jgi:hypothetical protein
MLTLRAFANETRALSRRKDQSKERRITMLGERADRLMRKQAGRIKGRHLFFGQLAGDGSRLAPTKALGNKKRKGLMKDHGKLWERLAPAEKAAWERKAVGKADQARGERREEVVKILEKKMGLEKKLAKRKRDEVGQLKISACRYTEAELEELLALYQDPAMGRGDVKRLRRAAKGFPPVPTEAEKMDLEASASPREALPDQPEWVGQVAYSRALCEGLGLVYQDASGKEVALKFAFAMQKPIFVVFIPMRQRPVRVCGLGEVDAAGDTAENVRFNNDFDAEFGSYVFSHHLVGVDVGGIRALTNLDFLGGTRVVSDTPAMTFSEFLATLPTKKEAKRKKKEEEENEKENEANKMRRIQEAFPGFFEQWLQGAESKKRPAPARPERPVEDETLPDEADELGDEEIEELMKELREKRAEYGVENERPDKPPRVHVVIRGGDRKRKERGRGFDGFQAKTLDHAAKKFCKDAGIELTAFFDVSVYGESAASTLAFEWANRISWFLERFEEQEPPPEHEELAAMGAARGYTETAAFAALAETAAGNNAATNGRIEKIRSLFNTASSSSGS